MPPAAADAIDDAATTASPSDMRLNYEAFQSQWLDSLSRIMNERCYDLYTDAYKFVVEQIGADNENVMVETNRVMQRFLSDVVAWEPDRIAEETEFIVVKEKMTWFRSVLRQLLVAQTSMLMGVKNDRRTRADFAFTMPPNEQIVHMLYIAVAKRLRGRVFLYDFTCDENERDANTFAAEDLIRGVLEKAIRKLVPFAEIVNRHLEQDAPSKTKQVAEDEDDDAAGDEDEGAEEDELEEEYEEEDGEEEDEQEEQEDDDDEEEEEEQQQPSPPAVVVAEEAKQVEKETLKKKKTKNVVVAAVPPVSAAAVAVEKADKPMDKSAAEETPRVGESAKVTKLRENARALRALIDDLKGRRARTSSSKQNKAVAAALDTEIASREAQLADTRKRIHQKE